jgi:hypothetical protein
MIGMTEDGGMTMYRGDDGEMMGDNGKMMGDDVG